MLLAERRKGKRAMIRLTRSHEFEFAHRLRLHAGKEKNLHGHTGRVELTVGVADDEREESGVTIDYDALFHFFKEVLDRAMDRATLIARDDTEITSCLRIRLSLKTFHMYKDDEPTVENIAQEILEMFGRYARETDMIGKLEFVSVKFFEGSQSSAQVKAKRDFWPEGYFDKKGKNNEQAGQKKREAGFENDHARPAPAGF